MMTDLLTEEIIVDLAANVSSRNMETIALGFLGIDGDAMELLKDDNSGKGQHLNTAIIKAWRNKNSGDYEIQRLAVKLHKAAAKQSYINPNKVKDILGLSKEQAAEWEERLKGSDGAGTVAGPALVPPTPTAAAAVQPGGELTDAMVVKLSERIIDEDMLRKLMVDELKVPDYKYSRQMTNNRAQITSAAYTLLQEWRKSQEDGQQAFANLYKALDTDDFRSLRKVLKN